jgi:hypothetical protein
MQYRPWGFGLGTVPAPADVMVAKEGIAVTHIPTVESYLENYLLATGFELHSVVAGLWVNLGPAGLALGLVLAALLVRGLAELVSRRRASALVCFMVPFSLWFLAFGPLLSNLPDIAFTIGLVLAARGARAPDSATSEDALRTAPREPATA